MAWCLLSAKPLLDPIFYYDYEQIAVIFLVVEKKQAWKRFAKLWSSCLGLNVLNMALIYTAIAMYSHVSTKQIYE